MSWEEFYPYQRMMLYALLLALRDYHKGKPEAVNWVWDGAMERFIDGAGLTGKLKVETLLKLTPKKVEKCIRKLQRWD